MTLTINGEERKFPDDAHLTVVDLIQSLELGPQPVLVELNGIALYEREFAQQKVHDGDRVEIIRMVAGG